MSQIKGKNTKPEILVRKYLHRNGFRFKLHDKTLVGKPDIVLPKYKTIVEVYGCFWHGHQGCKYYKMPKSNTKFWSDKILSNIERDKNNIETLQKLGWNVIVIWECQLKPSVAEETLFSLQEKLLHAI